MKKNNILTQIFFWIIIAFILIQSIRINKLIFVLNWKELVAFILPMIIVVPIFLLLCKFLVPEILNLYQIKNKYDKHFIKNSYYILIFYLITTILLHLSLKNIIESFTTLAQLGKDLPLVYAHIVTPFALLLLRKFGNKKLFEGIIYGDMLLILFVIMIKIPFGGISMIYNEFLWVITGIILPTLIFAMIDIFIPIFYNFKN